MTSPTPQDPTTMPPRLTIHPTSPSPTQAQLLDETQETSAPSPGLDAQSDDSPSCAPSSPNSLARPDSAFDRPLSRQVSQSLKALTTFLPEPSTMDTPDTPSPKPYNGERCPRTGSKISTAPVFGADGVQVGVRIFSHLPDNPHGKIAEKSNQGDRITAILTSGPTLVVDGKPCMLTAAPLGEKAWRDTSQAIVVRYDKQVKDEALKMKCKRGRALSSLRDYVRSRANSVASGVRQSIPVTTMITNNQKQQSDNTMVGRTWLCSMGCEGALNRKRDWSLVELDPSVVGQRRRWNSVTLDKKEYRLKSPPRGYAKAGTRVALATLGSRNIPLEGTVGEVEENVFGYHTVQKVVVDREGILDNGDAGASVIDSQTGAYYGMLVMSGTVDEESDSKKKKKAKAKEEAKVQTNVAWFVPYQIIARDIGETFPLSEVAFEFSDPEAEEQAMREEEERRKRKEAEKKAREEAKKTDGEQNPAGPITDGK